jgi:hypothetical protein
MEGLGRGLMYSEGFKDNKRSTTRKIKGGYFIWTQFEGPFTLLGSLQPGSLSMKKVSIASIVW